MNVLGKVAVGVAVVAVAALCWHWSAEPPSEGTKPARSSEPGQGASAAETSTDGTGRTIETRRFREPEEVPDAETPSPLLRGRVIDVYGAGVAGVSLAVGDRGSGSGISSDLSSSADGTFEFSSTAGAGTIVSTDPRWATVRAGSTRVQGPKLSTVVVAPRIELGGRVVDSEGQPLPESRVQVHLPSHLAVDLGILIDGSVNMRWQASSDQEGRFVLRDVPAVAGAELAATLGGYQPRFVEQPASSTVLLELVLDRPAEGAAVIVGTVVDPFDAPVAGARVSAGGAVSRTDERGEFMIDLSNGETLDRIVAIAKGMQPAVRVPERDADGKPKWPERVTLRLGQAPLSITGKVMDRERRPVEGAKVWITDPLVVGMEDGAVLAETFLARKDRPFWAFVRTDRSGAFRLDGLLDRAYVVKALDPSTLMAVTRDGVQAGKDGVELQLASATYRELRGRVVGRDGSGISGVSVRLTRPALAVRIPGHPNASQFQWTQSTPIATNPAGEFSIKDVPTEGVQVQAYGDAIQTAWVTVEPGIDPKAFVVQVDRTMRLKVELAPPMDRADAFKVLKATGRHMILGARGTKRVEWPLLDGRSEVLSLGEGARTAVFLKDGVEVGRVRVQLQPGQVNTIRF